MKKRIEVGLFQGIIEKEEIRERTILGFTFASKKKTLFFKGPIHEYIDDEVALEISLQLKGAIDDFQKTDSNFAGMSYIARIYDKETKSDWIFQRIFPFIKEPTKL